MSSQLSIGILLLGPPTFSFLSSKGLFGMFSLSDSMAFIPPATKLGQGYIFTGVCDSVHRGGIPAYTEADPTRTRPPKIISFCHTVNARVVRILLECILVILYLHFQIKVWCGWPWSNVSGLAGSFLCCWWPFIWHRRHLLFWVNTGRMNQDRTSQEQ